MWRFFVLLFILSAAFLALNPLSTAQAAITPDGDVEAGSPPAPSNPSTWDDTTIGYIGYNADGSVTVDEGSDLLSRVVRIGHSSNVTGIVTVDGEGSTWTNNGNLSVGRSGSGTLNITDGGALSSDGTYLGYDSGSTGFVTIDGVGSTWSEDLSVDVGYYGIGRLDITNGAVVNVAWVRSIGSWNGSTGVVNVDGAGTKWTRTPGHLTYLWVGEYGDGRLKITNGGMVESYQTWIGVAPDSTGVIIVDGVGSKFSNTYLKICNDADATGSLNITGGGEVSVSQGVGIRDAQSLLAIDVGNGSKLTTGSITNNGIVRILAGAGPSAGEVVSPIYNEFWSWNGSGVYQAVGGTWYAPNAKFTVSAVQSGESGNELSIRSDQLQRVLIHDSAETGWTLGASFLAETVPTTLRFTATAMDADMLAGLAGQMEAGHTALGAWDFTNVSGYNMGDPVYLSMGVSAGYDRDDLGVWRYDGNNWTPYDATDLTCNGDYASFTVTSFSGYAVTGPQQIPGDANYDGVVNGSDAAILATNWLTHSGATWGMGDFNHDGAVNELDATMLAANWGYGSVAESSTVPEPSSLTLLVIGTVGVFFCTGRRK